MESRIEKAIDKKHKGYNCAQAVACSYCDLVGIDEKTMFKITEAFGLGMGNMEGTCGAISGACVVAGLKNSDGMLDKCVTKGSTSRMAREIMTKFYERNGAVICKELKGVATGKVLRPCDDCVRDAAEFLEQLFENSQG